MSTIRTRIAPSPTGFLHVGTARTALFNYLFAKKYGGAFVLRIEDTDLERSDKKFEKDIFEGLRWLGIDADESPEQGGDYGPYRQSERTQDYAHAVKKLLAEEKAFYCFHTEQELEQEKDELMAAKKPILHICEYRTLDQKEAEILIQTKPSFIIRFKTPIGKTITFNDMIRGELTFASDLLGDFSIAKRIDMPLYNLAVVVDDEAMKISHVIRGEDHIANTPKQVLLIEALEFPLPIYAHLPLILGQDRSKLSKRHGATSVIEYREMGYLPEALFNFMALLGWNPGTNQEIFNRDELISQFSLEHVQKSGAIFDIIKLDWMNGEYIRKKTISELVAICVPFMRDFLKMPLPDTRFPIDYIEKVVALEQPRLKKLSEIGERVEYFFQPPQYDKELLRWKEMTDEEVSKSLKAATSVLGEIPIEKFIAEELKEKIYKDKNGVLDDQRIREVIATKIHKDGMEFDFGRILWPLRVALTGKKNSPGPFEILEILGVEEAIKRLTYAIKKIGPTA